ncbi:Serine carboxypeptidase-like 26 [Labeo rohita]|uniref:Serine carboxypeptidase-like 26 n=1 Tax=Labeo rohita TaxID=84645 RepID=A0ABQ8L3R2_LABRO|nr:Serine carboxypeptidase-like 26 [Labeo rohita]
MSQLARHLLLWSQHRLKSLRATHIPGDLNRVADSLSQQISLRESTHCKLWYSLTEAPLGIDALAHSWLRDLRKYAFPPVSLIAQTLCKVREDREQVFLVALFWPIKT